MSTPNPSRSGTPETPVLPFAAPPIAMWVQATTPEPAAPVDEPMFGGPPCADPDELEELLRSATEPADAEARHAEVALAIAAQAGKTGEQRTGASGAGEGSGGGSSGAAGSPMREVQFGAGRAKTPAEQGEADDAARWRFAQYTGGEYERVEAEEQQRAWRRAEAKERKEAKGKGTEEDDRAELMAMMGASIRRADFLQWSYYDWLGKCIHSCIARFVNHVDEARGPQYRLANIRAIAYDGPEAPVQFGSSVTSTFVLLLDDGRESRWVFPSQLSNTLPSEAELEDYRDQQLAFNRDLDVAWCEAKAKSIQEKRSVVLDEDTLREYLEREEKKPIPAKVKAQRIATLSAQLDSAESAEEREKVQQQLDRLRKKDATEPPKTKQGVQYAITPLGAHE
ncbi:hypothetical protein Rhopal_003334-T1 [Rhodotorula paludigena]|uniref:Plus3 domain-containing protein n=1 Tax=Rhodotorula paludigena TaxID=86838 RepID=A0AAV5GKF5_9BASI|nr:hypothetical protein Rhopal_003334-T1 [Rhodotorula paludigena]